MYDTPNGITEFRVKGLVVERETHAPLPGLRIKAFDRELRYAGKLPITASTDGSEHSSSGSQAPSIRRSCLPGPIYISKSSMRPARSSTQRPILCRWRRARNGSFASKFPSSICRRLANTASI